MITVRREVQYLKAYIDIFTSEVGKVRLANIAFPMIYRIQLALITREQTDGQGSYLQTHWMRGR